MLTGSPTAKRARTAAGSAMGLLYFAYLLSFGDRILFSLTLRPIKATLHLSDTGLGLLAGAAFALSYAIFSPLGGYLVDRWPRKAVMAGAVSFWSLASAATGLAGSFLVMAAARVAVGIGEAFLHPLAVSLVGDSLPPARRPRAFSLYFSAGAVGAIVALLFGGLLLKAMAAAHGGIAHGGIEPWRILFLATAAPGVLLSAIIVLALREPPRSPAAAADGPRPSGLAYVRSHPLISLALFLGVALAMMGPYTLVTWEAAFLGREFGWTAGSAGLGIALTSGLVSLLGCMLSGPMVNLLRRWGRTDAVLLVAGFSSLLFAAVALAGTLARTPWQALGLFGLGSFWAYTPSVACFAALGEAIPSPVKARLAGVYTLSNGVISNSVGPFLVGWMSDRVFAGPGGLRCALAATLAISGVGGAALILPALGQYRRRMAYLGTANV